MTSENPGRIRISDGCSRNLGNDDPRRPRSGQVFVVRGDFDCDQGLRKGEIRTLERRNQELRGGRRGCRGVKLALFRSFVLGLGGGGKWLCGLRFRFAAGGLEAFEVDDGLVLGALDAGDEALEAGKGVGPTVEGGAGFGVRVMDAAGAVVFDGGGPDLSFGAAEAAEAPGVIDELVDQFLLELAGGLPGLDEAVGEGFELFGIFARDDLGSGVDAGFECVETDGGFAGVGRGPRGEERVFAICFYLFECGHEGPFQFECGMWSQGKRAIFGGRD